MEMKLKSKRKPAGYWQNYDNCYEEAKKYLYLKELISNSPRAYSSAKKNGWLKDYTWFKKPEAYNKKWYYDTCKEEALKYRRKVDFQKCSRGAYDAARNNGWLSDYTWLESNRLPNGYWDYEHCYEEAKKYSCLSEFERSNGSAYNVALKNGWLDDYTWFETPILKELDTVSKIHTVYVYEDADNKVAYVGRSKNWKKRHSGHKRTIKGKSDGLKNHFDSIGKEIPIPIILEEGLTAEESRDREDYWKKYYANNGWRMLNKAATGKNRGSLGGGFRKWNKEACYEEAKKYETITEFSKGSPGAHDAAYRNGWLKEYTWFMTKAEAMSKARTKWTYEACYEEAKKYTSRGEFCEKCSSAWSVAKEKGWIDEYTWLEPKRKPAGYWRNYDNCYNEAKKYKTTKEFCIKAGGAYVSARVNGWLDEFFPKAA